MTTRTSSHDDDPVLLPPRRAVASRRPAARVLRRLAALALAASAAVHAQAGTVVPGQAPRPDVAATTSGPIESVRKWLGKSDPQAELIPADDAFKITVRSRDANTLVATLTPAPNYYLYRDRIAFSVVAPTTSRIAGVTLPQGERKADPTFGTVQVYHHPVAAVIALQHGQPPTAPLQLRARYQGCNEPVGVCYPPIEKIVSVALPGAVSPAAATPSKAATRRAE